MATPKLPAQKRELILKLYGEGITNHARLAQRAGVSTGTVFNVLKEAAQASATPQDAHERFCDLRERFRELIGYDGKTAPPPAKPKSRDRKILVINDLHCPAHDREALAHIIKTHAMDTHKLIIAGDLADSFNWSRYPKFYRPWSGIEELREIQAVICALADAFPEVDIISGNHDSRWVKYLERHGLPPEALEFLEFIAPGAAYNPLLRLTEPFANVNVVEPRKLDFAEFPHIHQVGSLILSHAEKFSKVANKAVADVIYWLKSFAEPAGLVAPFTVVGHAHTHQAGTCFHDFGVVGIEMGCCCKNPDYSGDPKLRGAQRPPVVGYTTFYQDANGNTDINRSKFHVLRWGAKSYM